jgi:hypothetical protein
MKFLIVEVRTTIKRQAALLAISHQPSAIRKEEVRGLNAGCGMLKATG